MNYLQRFIILLSVMVLAVMYHPAPHFRAIRRRASSRENHKWYHNNRNP